MSTINQLPDGLGGTGASAWYFIRQLERLGAKPLCYCDNRATSQFFYIQFLASLDCAAQDKSCPPFCRVELEGSWTDADGIKHAMWLISLPSWPGLPQADFNRMCQRVADAWTSAFGPPVGPCMTQPIDGSSR